MSKRKVISESDKEPKKKIKRDSNASPKAFVSKLSFDSAEQCLRSLIYPTSLADFFSKYWEKEPLFVGRKDNEYFKEFPTKLKIEEIAKKENLEWDKDLFLSQYEDGTETLEAEGKATVKNIQKFLKEKLTVLLDKPHRFNAEVYRLLQLLEQYFGCCVYCCLETHTEDAFVRKPGYTGKEEFILQVEGKKRWCLFKPKQKLAFLDSEDLSPEEIGGVTHEFVLETGDLLYFPRGTVYQAHNVSGEVSTHLCIELYEEYNWGNFISKIIQKAVNKAMENVLELREGLPINFLSFMGFGKQEPDNVMNNVQNTGQKDATVKAIVPKVSKMDSENQKLFKEKLEKLVPLVVPYLDPHWGSDCFFGKKFVTECLPPVQDKEETSETELKPPTDESLVQMRHPENVKIMFYDPEDDDWSDEDDEDNDDDDDDDDSVDMEDEDDETEKDKVPEKKSKKSEKDAKDDSKKEKSQKSKSGSKNKKENDGDHDMVGGEEELDESFSKPHIVLYHSFNNKIESDDDDECHLKESSKMKFPVHFNDALLILHRTLTPVAVCDLPLTSEERVELAETLWCEGLLREVKKT